MLFSTVLVWLLIAAAFVIALPALWLLARGLWPRTAAKNCTAAGRGLLVCFLLGLVPAVAGTVLVALISKLPKMGVLSVLVGGALIAWGFMGAGGIATLIGERLWPRLGEQEPWRQTLRGGAVLVCCALLPVVGWAFILPLLAILGWGINLRSWFLKMPAPEPALAPAQPPPLHGAQQAPGL